MNNILKVISMITVPFLLTFAYKLTLLSLKHHHNKIKDKIINYSKSIKVFSAQQIKKDLFLKHKKAYINKLYLFLDDLEKEDYIFHIKIGGVIKENFKYRRNISK